MTGWVVFAGWTLFVVLWETTAVALVLAALRLRVRARSAPLQYAMALAAFAASVAGAAAVPLVASRTARSSASSAIVLRHTADTARTVIGTGPFIALPHLPAIDAVAALAALLWAAGTIVLLVRLLGGLWLTRAMVLNGRPFDDEFIRQAIAPRRVRVLESTGVDAPVVVGWRRPTLLVPAGALLRLSSAQVSAVLSHELAHVRRHDYVVNLLQSFAEAPLFFSPALAWISRRVRETREFCCDDEALATVGDRREYVDALITLAEMNAPRQLPASVGIAGPRFVTRVRRLLQEDSMPRFIPLRIAALVCAFVFTVLAGVQISSASALRFPSQANSKVYKIGDPGVKAPVPTTHSVKATYTKSAMRRRIEGTVDMEEVIRTDGTVHDVRVVKSLDPGLDAEAVKAAKRWRFHPATKDGTPVNVLVHMEMTFTLKGAHPRA